MYNNTIIIGDLSLKYLTEKQVKSISHTENKNDLQLCHSFIS